MLLVQCTAKCLVPSKFSFHVSGWNILSGGRKGWGADNHYSLWHKMTRVWTGPGERCLWGKEEKGRTTSDRGWSLSGCYGRNRGDCGSWRSLPGRGTAQVTVRRSREPICPAAETWSAGHAWAEETPGGTDAQGCRSWTMRAWKAQINFHLTPPTFTLLRPHPIERKLILHLNPGHTHPSLNITEISLSP